VRKLTILAAIILMGLAVHGTAEITSAATVHWVNDNDPNGGAYVAPGTSCDDPGYATIQAAIAAAVAGDTIEVCAGTFAENLTLAKSLTLNGPQAGIDARGRVGDEAMISPASGVLLTLQGGSANSVIDGFTFSGGSRSIESTSGPIDGLQVLNNRIGGFTGSAVFLNDSGEDITLNQNDIDGSSATGSGGLVHLDQDNFDGFHFTNNVVANGTANTGLFVDGNHNVGVSPNREPLITGNLFDGNGTGANLGRYAFEFGEISGNTFSNNAFDGLQGGIQNSLITFNTFQGNGRSGLALTGFGGSGDTTRGAQNNDITLNCFSENVSEALFFSSGQFPGTISTNEIHQNNIFDNGFGATYLGTETIDAEDNWWGDVSGPTNATTNPGGTGDGVSDNVDADPYLASLAAGTPCSPAPPETKDDCKNGGWQALARLDGSSFKNQGDCIQYVNTGK
jgi:hypothetical protein